MSILLTVFHVVICIALIMIVLLQTGKGADMGAAFGGGGSQTLFGSSGASTFLTKATTMVAVAFMITSLVLAYLSSSKTKSSIMLDSPAPIEQRQAEPTSAENNNNAAAPGAESPVPDQTKQTDPN